MSGAPLSVLVALRQRDGGRGCLLGLVPAHPWRLIEHTFRYAWLWVWLGRRQMFAHGRGAEVSRMVTQGHELPVEIQTTTE